MATDAMRGWPTGLSPRTRGNRVSSPAFAAREGSIPANAGEPVEPKKTLRVRQVYPRERGGTFA